MQHRWTEEQTSRHQESLHRELGECVLAALSDDDVTEVMLNGDGEIWLDTRSRGLTASGEKMSAEQAESLISTVAGLLNRVVGEREPILEAELPLDGSRIQGLLPPIVEAPVFAIRKRASSVYPLARYLEEGSLSQAQGEVLREAILARRNVLISGGPSSGKTTFANALLHEMARIVTHTERFCILEDTYELRCEAPNHVILHTSEHVSLRALVRATLRLRPDRIVVGEVRGAEAHDLLKAWNTGNPGGCATVHANSAEDALSPNGCDRPRSDRAGSGRFSKTTLWSGSQKSGRPSSGRPASGRPWSRKSPHRNLSSRSSPKGAQRRRRVQFRDTLTGTRGQVAQWRRRSSGGEPAADIQYPREGTLMPSRIFISCSHDCREHLDRVLDLANRLRGESANVQLEPHLDPACSQSPSSSDDSLVLGGMPLVVNAGRPGLNGHARDRTMRLCRLLNNFSGQPSSQNPIQRSFTPQAVPMLLRSA